MNLLKNLWNRVVNRTSLSAKLTLVEDPPECTASELLECVLEGDGASPWFLKLNAPELFEKWYTGDLTEEAVRAAIPEFLQAHQSIASRVGEEYR
jgi:hypothetical protein